MTLRDAIVLDVAQNIALLPALCLLGLLLRRQSRDLGWWWMAMAFGVSWLADATTYLLAEPDQWVPSMVYPVPQSALIGAVILDRREARVFLIMLVIVALAATGLGGATRPDLLLRSIAWTIIAAVAWLNTDLPRRLRLALIVYFLGGYVTWLVHIAWLVVPTWYPYQAARLAGLLLFCWALAEPPSTLELVR